MKFEELNEMNEIYRKNNIGFTYILNFGLTWFLFNGLGENLSINDIKGGKSLTYNMFNIGEQENYCEILVFKKKEFFNL